MRDLAHEVYEAYEIAKKIASGTKPELLPARCDLLLATLRGVIRRAVNGPTKNPATALAHRDARQAKPRGAWTAEGSRFWKLLLRKEGASGEELRLAMGPRVHAPGKQQLTKIAKTYGYDYLTPKPGVDGLLRYRFGARKSRLAAAAIETPKSPRKRGKILKRRRRT